MKSILKYQFNKTQIELLKIINGKNIPILELSKIIKKSYSTTHQDLSKLNKFNLIISQYGIDYNTGKRTRIYFITNKGKKLLEDLKL